MRMKLKSLEVENYGGIKYEQVTFKDHTTIKGPNGAGKTRMQSAFFWLLFDKHVDGRTEFEVRPLDRTNRPLPGVIVKVTAILDIDGREVTLVKEHHEHSVKDQVRGYTKKYYLNEVPKRESQYKDAIKAIVTEDQCRVLTDLHWFCSGMHWQERRKVLLDVAGEIGTPQGFDELLGQLNGRSMKDYKKVLQDRRKMYVKQRDEIPPRMDELQRRMSYVPQGDTEIELEAKREILRDELTDLTKQRSDYVGEETCRQVLIDKKNSLVSDKIQREAELRLHLTDDLNKEITELKESVLNQQDIATQLEADHRTTSTQLGIEQCQLNSNNVQRRAINQQIDDLKAATVETICALCKQTLPDSMLAENKAKRDEFVASLVQTARKLKSFSEQSKARIEVWTEKLAKIKVTLDEATNTLVTLTDDSNKRLEEIKQIKAEMPEPDYSKDDEWMVLLKAIDKLNAQIGESVSDKIAKLDAAKQTKDRELQELNAALSAFDQRKKDATRLTELKEEQLNLSQSIADVDKELEQIAAYTVQESLDIEIAVNDKFKDIQWRLFEYKLNGEVDDKRCDATYNGVPFSDISTGEQIMVGTSVVNTLSKHYNIHLPLFVDHVESITLPIEPDTQVINLEVDKYIKGLEITHSK